MLSSGRARRLALVTALIAIATAVALTGASATNAASPQSHPIVVKPLFSNPQYLSPGAVTFGCQSRPIDGSHGPRCYQPAQIQRAYGYSGLLASGVNGTGKTIVIVDAFSNPYVANDLGFQDALFGLPAANFTAVAPQGVPAFDPTNGDMDGWAEEITLDVLWAHAMAPGAKIVLDEAKSDQDQDILNALKSAVDGNWGDVISQSFGEAETCVGLPGPALNAQYHAVYQEAAAKGITVFASSGDSGASQFSCDGSHAILSPSAPAVDPLVTGVGGTTLNADGTTGAYLGEKAWTEQLFGCNPPATGDADINCSGGGFSTLFSRPSFQNGFNGNAGRGVPDVSYDAGVNGGVLTHCGICNLLNGLDPSNPNVFFIFGGTSAGSPQWSALTADADQLAGHDLGTINPSLYSFAQAPGLYSAAFHDVTTGNNNVAEIGTGYNAGVGWDPVTGLGTPNAAALLPALAGGCVTTPVNGPTNVGAGRTLCIAPGTQVNGPVSVNGGTFIANGASLHGPVNATGDSSVTICGTSISGPLSVSGTTGQTIVGGGSAFPGCAGNSISGPASFSNNSGPVEVDGNTISGPLSFSGNTGGVHQSGNTVSGPISIH
ncbi:MAG: S53 family peptidase [Actinobacteria bacterium]|nr:S53 family peptidase [Actinomycetota bacterium]